MNVNKECPGMSEPLQVAKEIAGNSYGHVKMVFPWASLDYTVSQNSVHILLPVTHNSTANQRKEDNDYRKYFTFNLHEIMRQGCDQTCQQGSHKLWKSWKITEKSSLHGKIMEFEKT